MLSNMCRLLMGANLATAILSGAPRQVPSPEPPLAHRRSCKLNPFPASNEPHVRLILGLLASSCEGAGNVGGGERRGVYQTWLTNSSFIYERKHPRGGFGAIAN